MKVGKYFYCRAAYKRDPQIQLRFHNGGDKGFEHVAKFRNLFKKHGLEYSLEDAQAIASEIESAIAVRAAVIRDPKGINKSSWPVQRSPLRLANGIGLSFTRQPTQQALGHAAHGRGNAQPSGITGQCAPPRMDGSGSMERAGPT